MDVKNVSREVNAILGLIDTYKRYKQYQSRFDRKYEYYHPSEWGKCLRQQQYKHYVSNGLINIDFFEMESQKLRLFDKGHNMHHRWSNYFDDIGNVLMGHWRCENKLCNIFDDNGNVSIKDDNKIKEILEKNQTRIYKGKNNEPVLRPNVCACGCRDFSYLETPVFSEELKIAGNADIVLNCDNLDEKKFKDVKITFNKNCLPIKNSKLVIDMKTAGSNSWKNQIQRKGAHKEYIVQLTIYLHILGFDYGMILYENKDNSELYCHKVDRNDEWWDIIQWQAKEMIAMREAKTLPPPKASSKQDYMCKNCDFKSLCHKSTVWDDKNLDKKIRCFYKSLL